jgi:hypothetical protein
MKVRRKKKIDSPKALIFVSIWNQYWIFTTAANLMAFLGVVRVIVLVAVFQDEEFRFIRGLGYLAPGVIAYFFCNWRAYIVEKTFRVRYIKSKRVQIKFEKLQVEKRKVKKILSLMLPEVRKCFSTILA